MVFTKRRKIGRIETAQILNAEETIPANLLHLIRLDYTLFIKRLTDEALKESDGLTLRDQDLERVLEDALHELRG